VTDFGDRIIKGLESGDHTELLKMLAAHPSVEAQVVRRSLEWFEHGPEAVAEVVEAAVRERRKELEQGSVFLGTVGNNAPFVGLLGTVLGVVQAFQELEKSSGGAMGSVMGGIAEALVATAAGIVVALPAVVAFNYFSKKTAEIEDNARSLMSLVFAYQKRQPLVAGGADSPGGGNVCAERTAPADDHRDQRHAARGRGVGTARRVDGGFHVHRVAVDEGRTAASCDE
jgi:biopolymer transport protein ExbB/biopolymer transport protein TolQ